MSRKPKGDKLPLRYFAIGLKGWVQIRSAVRPPVPIRTESKTTIQQRTRKYVLGEAIGGHWKSGYYEEKVEPKELLLKLVTYKGGRTISTIKSSKFTNLLKVAVRESGMIELMPLQFEQLLAQNASAKEPKDD